MSLKASGKVSRRLIVNLRNLDTSSVRFKQAMFFIGNEIRNIAIDNLTKSGAVASGGLRSSVRFDISQANGISVLTVGAYGQPHARIVEHGGPFTDKMRRAMFAKFKDEGRKPKKGKGIIRAKHYKARPYLGPAVEEAQPFIEKILKDLV